MAACSARIDAGTGRSCWARRCSSPSRTHKRGPATTSRPARTIAQAQQLLKAKDLEEARTVLESLISHEPASAQAQLAKAQRPAPYLSIPSTPARPRR